MLVAIALVCALNMITGFFASYSGAGANAFHSATIGLFGGELLALAVWVAWGPGSWLRQLLLAVFIGESWYLWRKLGRFAHRWLEGAEFPASSWWSAEGYCGVLIVLTIAVIPLLVVRFLAAWRLGVGSPFLASPQFSLPRLFVWTAVACFTIVGEGLLSRLHSWPVEVGIILAWTGLVCCPLVVFAVLRPTLRPPLLLVAFLATVVAGGTLAPRLANSFLLYPTPTIFAAVGTLVPTVITLNGFVVVAALVWRRAGYRLYVNGRLRTIDGAID